MTVQPMGTSHSFTSSSVNFAGIVTLVREVQAKNAPSPMLVTLSGIVTLVREEQSQNAKLPMLVTLEGIV